MRFKFLILIVLILPLARASSHEYGFSLGDQRTYDVNEVATISPWVNGKRGGAISNNSNSGTAEFIVSEISSSEIQMETKILGIPEHYTGSTSLNFAENMTFLAQDGETIATIQGLDGGICPDLRAAIYFYFFAYPMDAMKNDCLLGWVIADQRNQFHRIGVDIAERVDPSSYLFSYNGTSVRISLSRLLQFTNPDLEDQIPDEYNSLIVNYTYSVIIARENYTYGLLVSHSFAPEFDLDELKPQSPNPVFAGTGLMNHTFGLLFDKETGLLKETLIVEEYLTYDFLSDDILLNILTYHVLEQGETSTILNLELLRPTPASFAFLPFPSIVIPIIALVFFWRKKTN